MAVRVVAIQFHAVLCLEAQRKGMVINMGYRKVSYLEQIWYILKYQFHRRNQKAGRNEGHHE